MKWCLSLILVLLSNGKYINTDHIYSIEGNYLSYGFTAYGNMRWTEVTPQDIENIKAAIGVYLPYKRLFKEEEEK